MKYDNLKPVTAEKLDGWKQLGDVAFDVIQAALKQKLKAEVQRENH